MPIVEAVNSATIPQRRSLRRASVVKVDKTASLPKKASPSTLKPKTERNTSTGKRKREGDNGTGDLEDVDSVIITSKQSPVKSEVDSELKMIDDVRVLNTSNCF